MAIKLKWKVSEVPTGRYRSFEHRSWPSAYFQDDRPAVCIYGDVEYSGPRARATEGLQLTICIADWSKPSNPSTGNGFTWRTLKQRAISLAQAKEIAAAFLERYPNVTHTVAQG